MYLPQFKDPAWQRRQSSPIRYARPRRRQLLIILAVLCTLVYGTLSLKASSSRAESFTPAFPASPAFWAGSSDSRLVTIHTTQAQYANAPLPSVDVTAKPHSSQHSLAADTSVSEEAVAGATRPSMIQEIQNVLEHAVEEKIELLTANDDSRSDYFSTAIGNVDVQKYQGYQLPDPGNYKKLNEKADELPDYVFIPLSKAVEDEVLEGWEDDWFSHASFKAKDSGKLTEPKIDFVYTWVNGSDTNFAKTMRPYELNSSLNDDGGEWMRSHGVNRYRDWDELRYSIRSIEDNAASFKNNIQILVNAVQEEDGTMTKQRPTWLKDDSKIGDTLQVLSQEDFFGPEEKECLPTFNSITIENQLYNTPSDTDRLFALSDDMFLAKPHAASDIYSPLFGTVMGFKQNAYNTISPPSEKDALRFGEKPYLIYTSWMLNRRFGSRKRNGQVHFGHSLSRSVFKEAMDAFPRPSLKSACQKFRGETGFQLYSWYAAFHYTIERHREALLWSYLMIRSDPDRDGYLDWKEREAVIKDLEEGIANEGSFRKRMYYYVGKSLEDAGLKAPKVNVETTWTSLDGPLHIGNIDCFEFNVNECLAPGFSSPQWDQKSNNPMFSTAAIFDRVVRQDPQCGDCLIKLLLNRVDQGLSPLLPHGKKDLQHRKTVLKALKRYSYVVVEPDALFTMVTDAEQVQVRLIDRLADPNKQSGQLCLNDDVVTDDKDELLDLQDTMRRLFDGLWATPSQYEAQDDGYH